MHDLYADNMNISLKIIYGISVIRIYLNVWFWKVPVIANNAQSNPLFMLMKKALHTFFDILKRLFNSKMDN